mgnify:CR=1 FL=1
MTINLGPIDTIATHYGEVRFPDLRPLCIQGGGKFPRNGLNLFTTDRSKVTCSACLEWLHA